MLNICEVFPIRKNLIRNIVQTPHHSQIWIANDDNDVEGEWINWYTGEVGHIHNHMVFFNHNRIEPSPSPGTSSNKKTWERQLQGIFTARMCHVR